MPILRFSGGSAQPGRPTTASPSFTLPASGISKPATSRSSVVLPQPDGPSSAKNSPSAMSRLTLSTARVSPNCFDTASKLTPATAPLLPADCAP